ncbi:ankyrin repeat-containing domain protein [Daldinia loculata]|uniref:ankyrin repeat-containing domain protein n=1 Tax=Daldinia loculata TaxID=103429 RepID=UPI0020C2C5E7|nr:ankyrin repeat-containing domain protein [Daldinia loculata]KAI1645272.1 ankyrin repeat-containing domain protein [Daldinia loculata]
MPLHYTGTNPSRDAVSSQRLPNEIFYLIARDFARLQEISRLSQMCRQLAELLKGLLYRRNVLDVKAAQEAATAENRDSSRHKLPIFESIKDFQMHARRSRINPSQFSVLHWAAFHGSVEVARATIRTSLRLFPEYLNVKDTHDRTPLSYAAAGGHVEVMQELMDAGCLVNAGIRGRFICPNSHSSTYYHAAFTPLTIAILSHQEAAATILARRTLYQDELYTRPGLGVYGPLHLAAWAGMPRIVEILLSNGYKAWGLMPAFVGRSSLHYAVATEDNTETIDILLGQDVSMNFTGLWQTHTPLECATYNKCFRNALHLIKKHLPSGEYGIWADNALVMAAGYDDGFAVTEALAKILNAQGEFEGIERAFFVSSKDTSQAPKTNKFLAQLLAVGLDKTYLDDGEGYLHWACQQPYVNITALKLMLENKHYPLDLNAKDDCGYTPLDHAEEWGHDDVAFLLREVYFAKRGDEV